MEKRYQVFISSTFQDLQNARQEVSQALLRADCFPAGMELFPAADEEQFEFIKTIIDQSDYYIIISAGRYGSIHPETGLSYTEMEYDYAVSIGKPIIRLLHKDPSSIADEGSKSLIRLLEFHEKLKSGRMVAFWETPEELGKEAVFALLEIKKTRPAIGWVQSDKVSTTEMELENAELRLAIQELESRTEHELQLDEYEQLTEEILLILREILLREIDFSEVPKLEIELELAFFNRLLTSMLGPYDSKPTGRPKIDKVVAGEWSRIPFKDGNFSQFLLNQSDKIYEALNVLSVLGVAVLKSGRWCRTEKGDRLRAFSKSRHHFFKTPPPSAP